jgi:hypothetical protein
MTSPLISKNFKSDGHDDPYSTLYVENLLGVFLQITIGIERMEKYTGDS